MNWRSENEEKIKFNYTENLKNWQKLVDTVVLREISLLWYGSTYINRNDSIKGKINDARGKEESSQHGIQKDSKSLPRG